MVRRLARKSRKDAYKSQRDYQTLFEHVSQRFVASGKGARLVVCQELSTPTSIACWGGYVCANQSSPLTVTLAAGTVQAQQTITMSLDWSRVGAISFLAKPTNRLVLTIEWGPFMALDIWGLAMGAPLLDGAAPSKEAPELLTQRHLIPETYYLSHDSAIKVDILGEQSAGFKREDGHQIHLKKCSYCGRLLPIDVTRLGMLAFHKHNAKKTRHQNECRACKKWRINDDFNPKRTTDQLHESSTITRERKLFLREPEILQAIKKRDGAGLKSQVWERFGRKCFRCSVPVELDNFQLDHTRPLAYLWPIDEFATCLCNNCNNEKKEKFPVDFYSEVDLKRLSEITGLPLVELKKKSLNEKELKRILREIHRFSQEWEPRTFVATARKIRELRPDIDLLEILKVKAPEAHHRMVEELAIRPPSVEDD